MFSLSNLNPGSDIIIFYDLDSYCSCHFLITMCLKSSCHSCDNLYSQELFDHILRKYDTKEGFQFGILAGVY